MLSLLLRIRLHLIDHRFVLQSILTILVALFMCNHLISLTYLSLDLESCNLTQIGFIQGCLSWVLKTYVAIQDSPPLRIQKRDNPCHLAQNVESDDIRKWLNSKYQHRQPRNDIGKIVVQTAYVTSIDLILGFNLLLKYIQTVHSCPAQMLNLTSLFLSPLKMCPTHQLNSALVTVTTYCYSPLVLSLLLDLSSLGSNYNSVGPL